MNDPMMESWVLKAEGLSKGFTLHLQGGVRIPVLRDARLVVAPGECVALSGPSGAGKSTLMRLLQGNYGADSGAILIRRADGGVSDLATASPREVNALRQDTIGHVSQFLRVIPRVSALEVVAAPLMARGVAREVALARAQALLRRLNLPDRLHGLPPATFSGGEQQRVNLARGFVADFPLMLLDEPTASLDAANREVVIALIGEAKARGAALVGIFHDVEVRDRVADRVVEVAPLREAA
ncbi:phosphonate C-P lyase system protein PhnL [Roseomonas xinghualingensis]|uniref:phosphonate C-P lyase system protein PhnL n=1 Tax=Roseomonas xinghualingensis TaxID=2986475 RepID=UPI0021F230B1|nr:phosphonate C-P lyase system protein PhnL [Roseomonas sp. SXEYE001]MCV4206299.1 phosphonate C-P lyase system protein PhnL [Roseomonas sp. SXEYE001]